jgi:beta-glucosidase
MKKLFKILGFVAGGILIILILTYIFFHIKWNRATSANMKLLGDPAPVITMDGVEFRDLNKNGQLDIYEDKRKSIDTRIEDLLDQMTLEEKAGLMFITMIGMNPDGSLNEHPVKSEPRTLFLESNTTMVARKKMNHFNIIQTIPAEFMATWNNNIQQLAERTRLGIPVTIATDPRHTAIENPGATIVTPFFSKWCSPLGFAAIGDTNLMREFGDIARQEYATLGIRLALSPMADLATEPRWGRINGTFGEDAELSAKLTKAYVLGFQGDSLNSTSVACMTKHFSGGGPQKDGEDAHFPYGAEQIYPGNNFDYHLIPFEKGAFEANTAQIMPYYGIPVGQTNEEVAFGFNKQIITGLLRGKYGFEGIICTDWGLITDSPVKPASAWGVEHLSALERVEKVINAGCDMFGGEAIPELIIELVQSDKLTEERIDISAKRILRDKFRMGLFDNPYVDIKDLSIIGNETFMRKGQEAQKKSLVLLKNEENILPLKQGTKVYVQGIDKEIAEVFTDVVTQPEDADCIILKINTPFEPRSTYFLERFFHQGRLDFPEDEKNALLKIIETKPTITIITLERPAIIPEIASKSKALIADFECQQDILLQLIFGEFKPVGRLPFELPSSIQAVENQQEDVPYDSENPLYPYNHGITYE